jgi:hypothetical protein
MGTSLLEQLALARFIQSGASTRHLRHIRPTYRERRERQCECPQSGGVYVRWDAHRRAARAVLRLLPRGRGWVRDWEPDISSIVLRPQRGQCRCSDRSSSWDWSRSIRNRWSSVIRANDFGH